MLDRLRQNFEVISRLRGFMELDAYLLLAEVRALAAPSPAPVLEVGVFCGRSLAALATLWPDRRTIGVDPFFPEFAGTPAFDDEAAILAAKAGATTPEQRIAAITAVLADLDRVNGTSLARNVELVRDTEEAFLLRNTERFQLIHVDAEHTYAAVRRSLDHLTRTLLPGGFLVVDDFLHQGFPDISEAVHTHALFRAGLWPIAYGGNKGVFVLGDEAVAQAHRAALARRFTQLGAAVRLMHDGAPAIDMLPLFPPVKRRKTLGRRLARLLGPG